MIFQPNLIANVVEPSGSRYSSNNPSKNPNNNNNITHFIGRFRYPLTTSRRSSVFLSHFAGNREPFSGPVRRLTFLHLGSSESPNVSPYFKTCTSVEFSGHLSSTNGVFGIFSQLPKVKNATIHIGSLQQHYFSESYVRFSPCPNMKKLKIFVDLEYFYSFQHLDCGGGNANASQQCSTGSCLSKMQYSLIHLVESILIHAKDSFPNLKNLTVELPENEMLCKGVQNLIQSCPGLRRKTQAEVEQVPVERNQVWAMSFNPDGTHSFPVHHLHQQMGEFGPSHFTHGNGGGPHHHPAPHGYVYAHPHQNAGIYVPTYVSSGQAQFSLPDGNGSSENSQQQQIQFRPPQQQPHQQQLPRPPPGFSPLPILGGRLQEYRELNAVMQRNLAQKVNHQQKIDVHQRVNSWLSSLEV